MRLKKKVLVIGLDGFDPIITTNLLANGELPNLAKVRAQGGAARLQTTAPAQTPVAWSTFATGTNPGGHGVFDFIRRDPNTYFPAQTFTRYQQKNPFVPPKAVNLRRGVPLWELLTKASVPATIVRFPCTYPPDTIYGRMLAGMGVPDLRGGFGTSTFYSSAQEVTAQESETVLRLSNLLGSSHTLRTSLLGPRDPKTGGDFRCDLTLHLQQTTKTLHIYADDPAQAIHLRAGEWSDWLKVKFKTGLLQAARGMVRFYLIRTEPVLELYASPVNFDPEAPLFPISSPPEYARELARKLGTFYTTGMVEDHNGFNNGRFGAEAYLDQCEMVLRERTQMMRYELERFTEGFFFCLFDTPDRVQHMFWRDGAHTVEEQYRACDRVIGQALEFVDDQTLLIVLSDHGMNSFERGFNLNTWLWEQGLLALKWGVAPGADAGDFLRAVDWSRTKAYALGLSGIYINQRGREAQGIVEPSEAKALQSKLTNTLTGLIDEEHRRLAIRSVLTREQLFQGAYAHESPDLLVNYNNGYRVSWATSLGGIPQNVFEDNTKKWSGDHLVDPALVPGVLFMNQPFQTERASLLDMAPTILAALGLPKGEAMEGTNLLQ